MVLWWYVEVSAATGLKEVRCLAAGVDTEEPSAGAEEHRARHEMGNKAEEVCWCGAVVCRCWGWRVSCVEKLLENLTTIRSKQQS